MNQDQTRALTMLRNVQAHMQAATARTPLLTNAGVAMKRLDQVIAQLNENFADQVAATITLRGATQLQYERRANLFTNYLVPLNRVAHSEIEDKFALDAFRLPGRRANVERLAFVARDMAKAAALHVSDFIAAGLPLDFIERLERATDRMLDTVTTRAMAGIRRSQAAAAIHTLFAEARKLVELLDAFVVAAFSDDHGSLASWKIARRLPAARTSKPTFA